MNDGVRHPTAASPASFILTGVLVWRTRIAPAWAAALTTLGGVLFVTARPAGIDPLAIAADLVLVAGLVPIGLAMLVGSTAVPPSPTPATSFPSVPS